MQLEFMGEGLKMSVLGMLIIFLVLTLIWFVLEIMKKCFESKKSAPAQVPEAPAPAAVPEPVPAPQTDDGELIAVIAAAIAASLGTSPYNIKIKSYKRVTR